jgi:7-cyano-7-deazaguanine synthase
MNNYDIVILYSGGADSTLLLEFAKRMGKTPYCLLIDYSQLHIEELSFAKEYCEKNGLNYRKISLNNLALRSALTTGEKNLYTGVSEYHVPGRNTMFLSVAFSVAEALGVSEIWYGPDFSDRENLFPDCYQEYIYRINRLFEVAGVNPIKVYAPTLGLTKEMVIKLLKVFGVKEEDLYSGYKEYA